MTELLSKPAKQPKLCPAHQPDGRKIERRKIWIGFFCAQSFCRQSRFMAGMRDARIVETAHEPPIKSARTNEWGQANSSSRFVCPHSSVKTGLSVQSAKPRERRHLAGEFLELQRAGKDAGAPSCNNLLRTLRYFLKMCTRTSDRVVPRLAA